MKVLVFFLFVAFAAADDVYGRYFPQPYYRYYGGNDGRYDSNDGRYFPDFSGQYIHDPSGNYIHDGLGGYIGDGSGAYVDNLGAGSYKVEVTTPPTTTTPAPQPVPQFSDESIREGGYKILKLLNDLDGSGKYHWEYETQNKISAEDSGKYYEKGTSAEALRAKGYFEYVGPDNVRYAIRYTADENGFTPEGKHLQTPPPLPEALKRAIEQHQAFKRQNSEKNS